MRTEVSLLRELLGVSDSVISDSELVRFIQTASGMIDSVFDGTEGYSDVMLAEMECWLAAHIVASSRLRQAVSERVGDVSVSYANLGEGLDSTSYGRMLKQLDVSGKISRIGLKAVTSKAIKQYDN